MTKATFATNAGIKLFNQIEFCLYDRKPEMAESLAKVRQYRETYGV